MAEKNKPICFMAMAFGHKDTDDLYGKQILPVLTRLGINAIRIDLRQSNDDINIQIIEQLKRAHFCISDLTYARQSVYYEAGFAQHTIPVIYMVRSDHLKPGQPDDRRVHFDLQMKPIISWENPEDKFLSTKLERRIKATFLRGWNKKKQSDDILKSAITQFENTPLSARLLTLRQAMISGIRRNGFSSSKWSGLQFFRMSTRLNNREYTPQTYIPNNCVAYKCVDDVTKFISIQSYNNITKSELQKLHQGFSPYALDGLFGDDRYSKINTFYFHHFILSIKPSPVDRIETVLLGLTPLEKGKCYFVEQQTRLFYTKGGPKKFISTWHFLTGIRSEIQLKEMIKQHLTDYFTFKVSNV